jgi:hypothetical protein
VDGQRLPGAPNEAYDGDERVRALMRGMEALTERVGRLEDAALSPRAAVLQAIVSDAYGDDEWVSGRDLELRIGAIVLEELGVRQPS